MDNMSFKCRHNMIVRKAILKDNIMYVNKRYQDLDEEDKLDCFERNKDHIDPIKECFDQCRYVLLKE